MLPSIVVDAILGCRVLDVGVGHHLLQPGAESGYTALLAKYDVPTQVPGFACKCRA